MTKALPSRAVTACAALVAIFPGFSFGIAATLAHSLVLTQGGTMPFGSFLYGLVALIIVGYLSGVVYAFAWNLQTRK